MFNLLAGHHRVIEWTYYLLANTPQSKEHRGEYADPARQRYAKHQHHFALSIMLQRQHEEVDLIDIVVDIGLIRGKSPLISRVFISSQFACRRP